jgi:DNA-binding LytR/AlgR family response regulator
MIYFSASFIPVRFLLSPISLPPLILSPKLKEMSNITSHRGGNLLMVDCRRKIVLLLDKIIMLEGVANYTLFHLKDGKKRMFSHTIHTYEDDLAQYGFVRVHRGFIINSAYVRDIRNHEKQILMEDNLVATVSRRRGEKAEVKRFLQEYN